MQGGMTNDQLRAAFKSKLPNVEPTDRDLTMFALGVEIGCGESIEWEWYQLEGIGMVRRRKTATAQPSDVECWERGLPDSIDRAMAAERASVLYAPTPIQLSAIEPALFDALVQWHEIHGREAEPEELSRLAGFLSNAVIESPSSPSQNKGESPEILQRLQGSQGGIEKGSL